MTRRYHILAMRAKGETAWTMEFGDYSRAVVVQEGRDTRESGHWVRGSKLQVLTVQGDTNSDLAAAMADLNRKGL